MLQLTDAFQKFLFAQQEITPFVCIKFDDLEGQEVEVTTFVHSFGSISRSLSQDLTGFSIASHSFQMKDTGELGEFLFLLRKNFGTSFWMDKTYDLLWGFRNVLTVAGGDGASWPLIATVGYGEDPTESIATPATMGYGTPPGSFLPSNRVTQEKIHLYTGRVYRKSENRINGDIVVNSKGIEHEIVEFNICTKINGSDVFAGGTTDTRSFTQVVKYGPHKIRAENKELKERNKPFSATIGFPNILTGDIFGGAGSNPADHVWYFPFQNAIDITAALYSGGTLRILYWDWIDEIWRAFATSDIGTDITLHTVAGVDGIYVRINNPGTVVVGPVGSTDTWTQYLAGSADATAGGHFDAREGTPLTLNTDLIDQVLCIETQDALIDDNPIRIVHDLLTSSRFIDFDETPNVGPVDASTIDFSAINIDYTMDVAFDFFNSDGGKINISYDEETSLKTVIDGIIKLTGMFMFTSAKKSTTSDRRIRISQIVPLNACIGEQANLLQFSTRSSLLSYRKDTDSDSKRDKIISTNFDSTQSTVTTFNTVSKGTGKRVLQLASGNQPKVYWFDSKETAQAIVDRLFLKFSEPIEKVFITLRWQGMPVELADLIQVHDQLSKEIITVQVFKHSFNLDGSQVSIEGQRSELLFGPDGSNITKRYAFTDSCAFCDTDAAGGFGTDASISVGTDIVTLAGSDTIDSNFAKVLMGVRIDNEQFRLKEILTTTTFKVDVNAAATHTNKSWSIGNTYHVF